MRFSSSTARVSATRAASFAAFSASAFALACSASSVSHHLEVTARSAATCSAYCTASSSRVCAAKSWSSSTENSSRIVSCALAIRVHSALKFRIVLSIRRPASPLECVRMTRTIASICSFVMFPFVEAATSDARLGCVAGGAAVGCLCRAAADVDGGASARNVFIPRPLPRAFEFFVGVGTGGARVLGAGSPSSECSLSCNANFNAPSVPGANTRGDVSSPSTAYRSASEQRTMSMALRSSDIPLAHIKRVRGDSRQAFKLRNVVPRCP